MRLTSGPCKARRKANFLDFIPPAMVWLSDQISEGVFDDIPKHRPVRGSPDECSRPDHSSILTLDLATSLAWAQSTTGRVLGSITDQSGAAVAGRQRSRDRHAARHDSKPCHRCFRRLRCPDLAPGTYKIHVEAKGFKSSERPAVTIEVATDVRADFALQPGNVSETVTVSGDIRSSEHNFFHSGWNAEQSGNQRSAAERTQL